jgi:hypothetical protein
VIIWISNLINPSNADPITGLLSIKCYYSNSTTDLINYNMYSPSELIFSGLPTIVYSVFSSSQIVMATNISLTYIIQNQIGIPQGGSVKIIIYDLVSYVGNTSCQIILSNNQSITVLCQIYAVNSTIN